MTHHTVLTSAWRSPSNIAIIKYWGKHGEQLPVNPSVSITLSSAVTETYVSAHPVKQGEVPNVHFEFEGEHAEAFASRIATYIKRLAVFTPCVEHLHLTIRSRNSFPHSSGIASSASAMSALALCIADIQNQFDGKILAMPQISEMARLGSGSAGRSLYGPMVLWGQTHLIDSASDMYAIPLQDVHAVFHTMCDSIFIVDDAVKAVSSSAGHALMRDHVFAGARIAQAEKHLMRLLHALRTGDIPSFGEIAEAEALTLHALMMTSYPPYLLMHPRTIEILHRIKAFRMQTGTPVYFTLDAGPNVHLLYPESHRNAIMTWIAHDLRDFCNGGCIIHDHAGSGPERIGDLTASSLSSRP